MNVRGLTGRVSERIKAVFSKNNRFFYGAPDQHDNPQQAPVQGVYPRITPINPPISSRRINSLNNRLTSSRLISSLLTSRLPISSPLPTRTMPNSLCPSNGNRRPTTTRRPPTLRSLFRPSMLNCKCPSPRSSLGATAAPPSTIKTRRAATILCSFRARSKQSPKPREWTLMWSTSPMSPAAARP